LTGEIRAGQLQTPLNLGRLTVRQWLEVLAMPNRNEKWFRRPACWWFARRVAKALALNTRGEVRTDGLVLERFQNRLQIEWRARQVHPWEKGLAGSREAELFAKQCLEDTSAAIDRLFEKLPEIEFIDFTVLDPESSAAIVRGAVSRTEAEVAQSPSPGMRVRNLGARYRLSNWRFEPLS
jgi:hypothetical protein